MGQEEDRRRFEKGREVREEQPRSIHGAELGHRRAVGSPQRPGAAVGGVQAVARWQ
jgi:hypothetical protein